MMALALRLALALMVVFGALNALAAAVGQGQPPHPALAGFSQGCEGQPRLCWNGIVPGVTSIEALRQMPVYLHSSANSAYTAYNSLNETYTLFLFPDLPPLCRVAIEISAGIVSYVELTPCENADAALGDLAASLGGRLGGGAVAPLDLVYGPLRVKVRWWESSHARINLIGLSSGSRYDGPLFHWHGFMPRWRYCQLEPGFPICG